MKTSVLLILCLAFAALLTTGCAQDSIARTVSFTHWHDEDTVIFVYDRDPSPGSFRALFGVTPSTTHVLICQIAGDNSMTCRDQVVMANFLNPHAAGEDVTDHWSPR